MSSSTSSLQEPGSGELRYRALQGSEIRLLAFEHVQESDSPLRLRLSYVELGIKETGAGQSPQLVKFGETID